MYDLIGDIRGYATPLKRLLSKMAYVEHDGVWQHPARKVIFVGDFVDRGPEQVESVRVARAMVERGHALAVMGNHEFNAVAWATPDPSNPYQFLRQHNDKNRRQHQEFLKQVGEGSDLHQNIIAWVKTLPLCLDLEGLRIVHACWHPRSLKLLRQFTDSDGCILPHAWSALASKGSDAYDALETVLKGLEIELPQGFDFLDKDGNRRQHIRTKWWELERLTYRDLAQVPPDVIESIPHVPVPADVLPGYDGEKLLFVGHYWLTGEPSPLNEYVACLDYSIASEDTKAAIEKGKLCAYRWQGEGELSADNFVWVS